LVACIAIYDIERADDIIRKIFSVCVLGALMAVSLHAARADGDGRGQTFCNPINLPYSFRPALPSRREAADPTMIVYKGEYWLFPSKSEGYWHSKDFVHWQLVVPSGLPIDDYAPTVLEIHGKLYWTAAGTSIYGTDDPVGGVWTHAGDTNNSGDPDLFRDDDGRVYLYSGCSPGGPIVGQEVDPNNQFKPLTDVITLFKGDVANHGWEIRAEMNAQPPYKPGECYIEGSWMTKHDGKYYLQYAAPGTEIRTYGDGVYVSDHPLGPFTYAPYSPFSLKPGGFADGAGHSSTFQDFGGRYWHITTSTISIRDIFERRLGVYPAWFTSDGQLVCNTDFGDYPQYLPGVVHDPSRGNTPGWMLLTYNKSATASSTLDGHPVENAVNEDMRTWWSAKTGDPGEWLQVDMGKRCRVNAAQINFADEGSTQLDRLNDGYGYRFELSSDGKHWMTVIDRSKDMRDAPHDYLELPHPVYARYARITNTHTPAGALFSILGFRLFGSGLGHAPATAAGLQVERDSADGRQADISWKPVAGADGYVIRYGIERDRLFTSYQVNGLTSVHIHTLNVGVPYFFTVDSFNDSGVTRGSEVVSVK